MPVWTPIPKYSGSVTNTEGSPLGLLLLFTYADTITSVTDIWNDETRPSTSYSNRTKPTTTYSDIPNTQYTINYLFQDSSDFLFQDGIQQVFAAQMDDIYSQVTKPTTSYTTIERPS